MAYNNTSQAAGGGRMTYGARPTYSDEAGARDELFGGAQRPRPERSRASDGGQQGGGRMTYGGAYGAQDYGGRGRGEHDGAQRPRQDGLSAPNGYRDYGDTARMDRGTRSDYQDSYTAQVDPYAERLRGERSRQQGYDQQYQGNGAQRMAQGRSAYQEEAGARDELFSGARDGQHQQEMTREMDNKQMLQMGINEHKETTATAKRALKIVHQTNEIADNTMVALDDQRRQMERIDGDIDKIGADLSYSERMLRYMRMCCCIGFFCSCCTEPERNKKDTKWREQVERQEKRRQQQQQRQGGGGQQQQQQRGQRGGQMQQQQRATYSGVNTQGLNEEDRQVIDKETRQQDDYLDQIDQGLAALKDKAGRMNEELNRQEKLTDKVHTGVSGVNDRMRGVNRQGFKGI